MSHLPITLTNYSLILPHKTCFEDFSTNIYPGSRVAIIGNNGSGKSSLLKMITAGFAKDMAFGYVPQIVQTFENFSGGQRFNKALTEALANNPDVLLLDEPTNHLDLHNRKSLIRMLKAFDRTVLIVTHDLELLRNSTDTIWHIDNGKIHLFTGNYNDYMHEVMVKRSSLEQELFRLENQKKEVHLQLMKEQKRASASKAKGEKHIKQRKWPTIVSSAKAGRAEETSGHKKSDISNKKQDVINKLSEFRLPEIINPKFSLTAADIAGKTLVSISQASVGYSEKQILSNINFSVGGNENIAIAGDNGSGKSSLIKAILSDKAINKAGDWHVPALKDIGYLDQHYSTLDPNKTLFDVIHDAVPSWSHAEVRRHLNDFLFRKNEEVMAKTATLSGGEKCRLSLAQIAAISPKLLILDEITNNLDLETRQHVIEVLAVYSGAMIVISHDEDFLKQININCYYDVKEFT